MLIPAFEVEGRAISAAVHRGIAQFDDLGPARNLLPNCFFWIQCIAGLVDIGQLDRIAIFKRARVRPFLARQHPKQRGFTRAVWPDHAHDPARRQAKAEIFDQQLVAIGLGQVFDFDHLLTQAWPIGDDDLCAADFIALGLARQFFIGVDTGLLLGLTRLCALSDPFQFALKSFLARFILAGFLLKAFGFLLQPA